jgi:stage V sporulation protein D (sporulation-specific penicillin-binding protein)
MLRAVVDYGTGGYVYMDGYSIGGKTGAAEKIPRDKKSYIVSFMGFAPAEDPEVLVYVTIDTPKVEEYDTSWAAQMVSKAIMEELVPYLGIPADNPDYERELYLDTETFDPVVKRGSAVDKDNISSDSADSLPPDADGDGIPDEVPELPTESETSGESELPSETETEPTAEPPSETEAEPPAETNPEPPAETLAEQEPPTEPES